MGIWPNAIRVHCLFYTVYPNCILQKAYLGQCTSPYILGTLRFDRTQIIFRFTLPTPSPASSVDAFVSKYAYDELVATIRRPLVPHGDEFLAAKRHLDKRRAVLYTIWYRLERGNSNMVQLRSAKSIRMESQEQRMRRFLAYVQQRLREGMDAKDDAAHEPTLGATKPKLFDEVPRLEGERIILSKIVEADAECLQELVDDDVVYKFLPTYLYEKQRADVKETIRLLYGPLFESKESLFLGIHLKDGGEMAGILEFYGLRDHLHKISVGYRLLKRFWGRGLATEAVTLAIDYLYEQTDIEIVTASTMIENAASAHVLQKSGFLQTTQTEEDWGFPEPTLVDKWFY